jgi:hypothetical protein
VSEEKTSALAPLANGDQPPTTAPPALVAAFMPDDNRAVCSFDLKTPHGRMLLQKCEEAPDEPVRELVNRRIDLVHVYAKPVEKVDEQTSEVVHFLRICLVDANDQVHACASGGIRDGIARILAGRGVPPWKPPVPVEIKLKVLKDSKQRLYLLEVFDAKKGGAK